MERIKNAIPNIPNWPIEGVVYRDITGLLQDPKAFSESCLVLSNHFARIGIDCIAAADARGFIWGGATASSLAVPLHLVRKPGKLPPPVKTHEFTYEYASTSLSIKANANLGQRSYVGIIDDVNATGGTALAIIELLKSFGVQPENIHYASIIDLPFLGGSTKIKETGANFYSVVAYNE